MQQLFEQFPYENASNPVLYSHIPFHSTIQLLTKKDTTKHVAMNWEKNGIDFLLLDLF